MPKSIPRIDPTTHQGPRPSPCWWPVMLIRPDRGRQLSGVVLRCACGNQAQLAHNVDEAGVVSPSVECPGDCGFHEQVTLEGWDLGVFPS